MLRKAFVQLVVFLLLFFGMWYGLSRIISVDHGKVERFSQEQQKKLGNILLKTIKATEETVDDALVNGVLDSLLIPLCLANGIDTATVQLVVIRKDEVNAFALPGGYIVLFSGLINYTNRPEELAGVLAHELGHLEHGHVTQKLTRELGLAILLSTVGGQGGSEVSRQVLKVLSSTAFDRTLEWEADAFAVKAMTQTNIDPIHLANLFYRLSDKTDSLPDELRVFRTHPLSLDRALEVYQMRPSKPSVYPDQLLDTSWEKVKERVVGQRLHSKAQGQSYLIL